MESLKCPKCRTDNPYDSKFCKECATPLPGGDSGASFTRTIETAAARLERGMTFAGRYEIIEELGTGGMGHVYRAHDTKLNEEIALKLIRPEIAAEKRTVERFRNEIKIARKITHKNVCRTHDLGEEKDALFITMEYVRGEDLKSLIRRTGQLTAGKAVSIARQIAEGLGEAHRLGIVHRDLKPHNIMIDKEGNAKIMDFGIARSASGPGTTAEGAIIGTPEYMSPEQVDGKPADARADIYALGVILFEMVTGRPPFEGETALGVAVKHRTEPPPDPRSLAPQIPAELGRVILRALEKDRERRYQTSAEFLSDLGALGQALPTTERPAAARRPTTSKRITVELTPKKLLVPAVALGVLGAAAILLWHPWNRRPAAPGPRVEHSIAVISFENLTGDPRHDGLIRAVPNLMITKFEAMGIPYVASWERLRDLLQQMGKDPDAPIDRESGFEACRREGIAVLITGEVTKAGNLFVTNIKALDANTKKSLASASSQGQGEESILIAQIDDLTGRIREKLAWDLPKATAASPVSEFTTASMEAYNEFLKGRDLYEKSYYEDARRALQKAIDEDPGFASAHLYMAYVHGGLRNVALQAKSYEKAKSLAARASEKERLYIEAAYANAIERDAEKQFRKLQELAEKFPQEKLVRVNLAGYFRGRKMLPEAIRELAKALELDPDYGRALELFAYVYRDLGDRVKAAEYLRKYTSVSPGNADPLAVLGEMSFFEGKLDEAVASYRKALEIKPDFGAGEWIAYIDAVRGDYPGALRSIDEYINRAPSKAIQIRGLWWKSYFHHCTGRRDLAMEEADRAIEGWRSVNDYGVSVIKMIKAWYCYDRGEYDQGRRFMQEYYDFNETYDPPRAGVNGSLLEHYLALADARQGRIESAKGRLQKALLFLSRGTGSSPRWTALGRQLAQIVQAEILLAEGKAGEAIRAFAQGSALTCPGMNPPELLQHNMPIEQDVLARAYRQAGDLDKAVDTYRKLLTFDPASQDRRICVPVYHYRLARLYEEKGEKGLAAEHYRVFLDLWKDADPGIPEVEDARKRLAGL